MGSRSLSSFFSFILTICCAVNGISPAQNSKAVTTFKLQKVRFMGSSRYAPEQLLAASGLKIGADTAAPTFQEAATQLSRSGAFSEVKYSFNGMEAEYQLTDSNNFVPCVFENLVWISDQELSAALRQRIALFTGQVPLNGDLATGVTKEIEAILREKGVAASVSVLPAGSLNGPISSMAFSATTPRVEIAEIQFTGASANQTEALRKATAPLIGTEYRQTMVQDFASNSIRPIYLNQGYLHVVLGKGQATPISTLPELANVRITVPIEEGSVYRLAALNWPGSDILPAPAAPKLYLLKPGEVLNQDLLKKSLSNVGSAYFAKGFLKASIKANPAFDETAHTVTYDIVVVPGELYHLRNVEFKNLSDAQLQKVKEVWKLKAGDAYDPTYPPNFLVTNRNSLRILDGWSAIWTQKIYDDEKVVDVVMTFRPGGPPK